MLVAAGVVLATAGAGAPDARAASCGAPAISGTAQVGATLKADAGACSDLFPPDVMLEWHRCTGATLATCTMVKNAEPSPSSYSVAAADAGLRLAVKQTATGGLPPGTDTDWAFTEPVPQPPAPPPGTPPPPPPPPPGSGGGQARPLLSPFPVVTIAGRLTRRGARLSLLSVDAPRGSLVRVRCRGRSCPAKRGRARVGRKGTVRLRRFQHRFRAGTVLELRIGKPGFVGKYTQFKIRAQRPPLRVDMCLEPGASAPSACPA